MLELFLDVGKSEELLLDLFHGEKGCIGGVELSKGGTGAIAIGEVLVVVEVTVVGRDPVEVAQVDGMGTLLIGEQSLVHLLTVPDADGLDLVVGLEELPDRLGEVADGGGRCLLHQYVTGMGMLVGVEHQIHRLVEGHDEAGHGGVGHCQWLARLDLLHKERDDRTAGCEHVAIPGATDEGLVLTDRTGLGYEHLLHHRLAHSHGVDGIGCFVGGEANYFSHPCIDAGGEYVVGADDVGLHRLHGEELAGGDLLQRSCTEDVVNAVEGITDTAVIAYITDVVLDLVIMVVMAHVILFLLITAEDPNLGDVGSEKPLKHRVAKGTGATGDEDGFVFEHNWSSLLCKMIHDDLVGMINSIVVF